MELVSLTLDTATAVQERANVPFDCTSAHELVPDQVGVVGRRDVVLRKWAGHVHPNSWLLVESRVLLARKERDKVLGLPCTVLPGDRRRVLRWGNFGGGGGFRCCCDLFWFCKNPDEQFLEAFLGFGSLGIIRITKREKKTRSDGCKGPSYLLGVPHET